MTKATGSQLDELYVIGLASRAGIVKIGRSGNTRARFLNIQACCPLPLVILHIEQRAGKFERFLHSSFASLCLHGEWFDFGTATEPVSEVLAGLERARALRTAKQERIETRNLERIEDQAAARLERLWECRRCGFARTGKHHRAICLGDFPGGSRDPGL